MDRIGITKLIDQVLQEEIFFEEFSQKAQDLGLERLTLDLSIGAHFFYGANGAAFTYHLPKGIQFTVSSTFNEEALRKAIDDIDARRISPEIYYSRLGAAGIAIGIVFLKQQKILYVAASGDFYLEEW